jgi:glycosyltransferase involved in cell wall biosynthesis
VLFFGKVDNVQEYFQAADIFVSASNREGFPNVLIEAMATGLIPIVIEIPDIHRHIIKNRVNGIVVTGRDPITYAENILSVVDDPQLMSTISDAAVIEVSKLYSIKAIADQYIDLYSQLLHSRTIKNNHI